MIAGIRKVWQGRSLAERLILVLLVCSSLGNIALLSHQVSEDVRQYDEALRRQAVEDIETLVPAVGDQALIGDYTAIQQIADRFAGHANVILVRWIDARGKEVLAAEGPPPSGLPAPVRTWLGLAEVEESRPVAIGGRQYGTLTVRLSPAALERRLWSAVVGDAVILLLAWLGQVGLTLVVLRRSLASLIDLDSAVRRIETGDLSQRLTPNGSPEVRRLIGAFNDMSEALESANRRILGSLRKEEAAHRELTRFSEILTHHLQEPVRQLISFSQILERGDGDDHTCLTFIREGAARLKSLLADIELYLALSHLPGPESVESVVEAIRAAMSELAPAIEATGAEIILERPLPDVWLDRRRLTLLFKELICNAMEYRRAATPPRIHVAAQPLGGFVRFSVDDNGIGIESRYLDRIFGVFNRLHTREEHPGNGIGLAMVRKIVLAAGGEIGVKSAPGQGSAFFFTLPASQEAVALE